jgi:hypothetical protein
MSQLEMWLRVIALLGLGVSLASAPVSGWFAIAAVCAAIFLEPQKWH